MAEEGTDDSWLLTHWRLFARSGAAAVAIGLWATALGAGGDMSAADPLLAAACFFSLVNLAAFAELSKLSRTIGIVGLVAFFVGTWFYIKWTHPAGVSDSIVSDWFHAGLRYFEALIQSHLAQLAAVLCLGIALGHFGPREFLKLNRTWYRGYDIFKLAKPELMKKAIVAEEEVQQLSEKITRLAKEREQYAVPFGSVPVASGENPGLTALREAAVHAHAAYAAAAELRSRARAGALEDVYEKLRDGRLIARGYIPPLAKNSEEKLIPAGHWRIIQFNSEYTAASSRTVTYVGIAVARARWF